MLSSSGLALLVFALISFAGNSVFGRLGIADAQTSPLVFGLVRLASGALMLSLISKPEKKRRVGIAPLWLFGYMAAFSFAYRGVQTGVGALALFGAVQITMTIAGIKGGQKLSPLGWVGNSLAVLGLVVLLAPGDAVLSPPHVASMMLSGVCWGLYSLAGRASTNPRSDTARNFRWATLLFLPLLLLPLAQGEVPAWSNDGLLWAALSGCITSALGYAAWFAVLPKLAPISAASLQLLVPLLAGAGGVLFTGESPGLRMALSGAMILGGLFLYFTRGKRT